MSLSTAIEWTDSTWNPVTGCTKISSGCANCYAERLALRLQAMGNPSYKNGFSVTLHEDMLELPLKWKKPQAIFVNSMSDLFHEDIPVEFIKCIFSTMRKANWHRFQILTKRSERMLELSPQLPWAPNIWMGVTVENKNHVSRIEYLKETGAVVKFLSLEPLLGPLPKLHLNGIDWVIVGGESGPRARHIEKDWVVNIKNQCLNTEVPFFFKQWGGTNKKKAGRELEGRIWSETPALLPNAQLSF
jgi:protein gp37